MSEDCVELRLPSYCLMMRDMQTLLTMATQRRRRSEGGDASTSGERAPPVADYGESMTIEHALACANEAADALHAVWLYLNAQCAPPEESSRFSSMVASMVAQAVPEGGVGITSWWQRAAGGWRSLVQRAGAARATLPQ